MPPAAHSLKPSKMRDDIMEDFEIGIRLQKEMELRNLAGKYPALKAEMYAPWGITATTSSSFSAGHSDSMLLETARMMDRN